MKSFSVSDPVYSKVMKFVCNGSIPDKWVQPFVFKPKSTCLWQYKDGPCGLFAAIQAYINLLIKKNSKIPSQKLLVDAILMIQQQIRPCFVFCTNFDPQAKRIEWVSTQSQSEAEKFLITSDFLSRENATILFTISIAILVGPIWLNSYAIPDTFITEDGQTNMTFVLLMISGEILDSYHDGNSVMGGIVIKGALVPQRIGLLSINDTEGFQKRGMRFGSPTERIWIAYYGGHFTTIMATATAILEFDPLSRRVMFTTVTEKHIFYKALYDGMRVTNTM